MSFIQNNENFLKFGVELPLRGLNSNARTLKYQNEISADARRRFHSYFELIKDNPREKIKFYEQVLLRFGDLERQFFKIRVNIF